MTAGCAYGGRPPAYERLKVAMRAGCNMARRLQEIDYELAAQAALWLADWGAPSRSLLVDLMRPVAARNSSSNRRLL
jgi:hypothetical protein